VKRWINILGRGGTTLIAISLALLLVSLIPQIESSSGSGTDVIQPGEVKIMFSPGTITPQQEVHVSFTTEGTLSVYLLDIKVGLQIINGTFDYGFNSTDLQELLDNHPEQIKWEHEVVNTTYEQNYNPSKLMNATVVAYNQGTEMVMFDFDISLKSSLAPGDKVRTIAYFAAPIGVIMAVPWLLDVWKQRKQK